MELAILEVERNIFERDLHSFKHLFQIFRTSPQSSCRSLDGCSQRALAGEAKSAGAHQLNGQTSELGQKQQLCVLVRAQPKMMAEATAEAQAAACGRRP
jgi:conjugal transfer/entry exclusion protein